MFCTLYVCVFRFAGYPSSVADPENAGQHKCPTIQYDFLFCEKKWHKVFATFGGHVDSLRRCCWCFLYVFLSVHWTPWVFWKCCVENLWPYSRNLGFWKNTTYNAKRKWHQNCNLEVRNANNMDIKFAILRSDMQKNGYEKIWKPS